jgi:acetylglutamate kinase
VVHGGGPQIDNALKKIGKQGTFVQGMRITDEETMEVVEWVLGGEVQQDIVMLINHYGGQAVGLTGKDGGLIRARKMSMPDKEHPGEFLDIGFVGAAGRRLHPDHLADRLRPGRPGLQHQCRRRRRQDRGNPESRKADHDDQHRRCTR